MWLLIDDERDLNCEVTARDPKMAREMLEKGGFECVCFDHDLASYESGYDILVWAIEEGYLPKHVQLVTANPVGRMNMRTALEQAGYYTRDGFNFFLAESHY